jgi:hypothetical protein
MAKKIGRVQQSIEAGTKAERANEGGKISGGPNPIQTQYSFAKKVSVSLDVLPSQRPGYLDEAKAISLQPRGGIVGPAPKSRPPTAARAPFWPVRQRRNRASRRPRGNVLRPSCHGWCRSRQVAVQPGRHALGLKRARSNL